jgi:hypothetical protein
MKKIFLTQTKVNGLPANHIVETYLSDERPQAALAAAVYGIVVKRGKFLQADLKEGKSSVPLFDIPGGDIPTGLRIEDALTERVLEQTGILIGTPTLVAYKETTINGPKPLLWPYPYPTSYVLYYSCEFRGGELAHGATWTSGQSKKAGWYSANKLFMQEIFKAFSATPVGGKILGDIRIRRRVRYFIEILVILVVLFGAYLYAAEIKELLPADLYRA